MTAFLVRRVVLGAVTLLAVFTLTFLMVVSVPGNPLQSGQRRLAPEVEQALRARFDMDHNARYYLQLLGGAMRFDFGPTFQYNDWTCNQILAQSLPVSVLLGLTSIVLAVAIGVPLGVAGAVQRRRAAVSAGATLSVVGACVPSFVVGTCLLLAFAVHWKLAPVGGWGTWAHVPLPAMTLALPFIAYITRLTRVSMTDALSRDFIRTALARGVSRRCVIWDHAFPMAIAPVLSYLGPATAQAMTGSFVVEKVFNIPGMGQHFVNAALNRDPGLLMATVMVFSTLVIVFNLGVDAAHAWLDPRLRERMT